MARQNTTIVNNFSDLLPDEMVDEYEKLSRIYIESKLDSDTIRQQIYNLKRQLEQKTRAEEHLNNELEAITEHHEAEITKLSKKYHDENDGLRQKVGQLRHFKENYSVLETELNCLKKEKSSVVTPALSALKSIVSDPNGIKQQQIDKLETENEILIDKCNELNDKCMETQKQLSALKTSMENLQDRCDCAEENLRGKRDELEEKDAMVDGLNEQIAQLTAELAQFKANAADPNQKGNSLFAEVDDQRQYLRKILANQKQRYNKMKYEHENAMRQIRQLKRENASMHREVKICSEMFYNANDFHRRRLSDRIYWLHQEKDLLETKLKQSEEYLCQLNKNDSTWVSAMLEFCDNQTKKLQADLKSARIQKAEAEDLYVNAREDNARWRFEALKSRCTIINRELLLEEHNISFSPMSDLASRAAVNKYFPDVSKETPQVFDTKPEPQSPNKKIQTELQILNESNSTQTAIVTEPQQTAANTNTNIIHMEGNLANEMTQLSRSAPHVSIIDKIIDKLDQSHIINTPKMPKAANAPNSPKFVKENNKILHNDLDYAGEKHQNPEDLSNDMDVQDIPPVVNSNINESASFVPQYRRIKMTPSRRELICNIRDTPTTTEQPCRRSLQFKLEDNTDNANVIEEKKGKILAQKSSFMIKHVHLSKENPSMIMNIDPRKANNQNLN